jgi:hypothetical protein
MTIPYMTNFLPSEQVCSFEHLCRNFKLDFKLEWSMTTFVASHDGVNRTCIVNWLATQIQTTGVHCIDNSVRRVIQLCNKGAGRIISARMGCGISRQAQGLVNPKSQDSVTSAAEIAIVVGLEVGVGDGVGKPPLSTLSALSGGTLTHMSTTPLIVRVPGIAGDADLDSADYTSPSICLFVPADDSVMAEIKVGGECVFPWRSLWRVNLVVDETQNIRQRVATWLSLRTTVPYFLRCCTSRHYCKVPVICAAA